MAWLLLGSDPWSEMTAVCLQGGVWSVSTQTHDTLGTFSLGTSSLENTGVPTEELEEMSGSAEAVTQTWIS